MSPLPEVFGRYAAAGGALIFGLFEAADGDEAGLVAAIQETIASDVRGHWRPPPLDGEVLRALGSREIDEVSFFGDWFDPVSGELVRKGRGRTSKGDLTDPRFSQLAGVAIESWGVSLPSGAGGQFAYAFSDPPYGLQCSPAEAQAMFDDIRALILPPGQACEIRDWSSARLAEASAYFNDGLEWWGVFLFTIHCPALRRLAVIVGSATD